MLLARWVVAAAALCLVPLAIAQDWAKAKLEKSPRHQEWVDLKHGDRTVKAFVVYPEKAEKATTVILIHEIMGLTDWVMSVADELAAEGFIAIAPDFLSEMGPNKGRTTDFPDVAAAREAISGLPADQITADLDAAVAYAKTIPSANGKIAVAGFCWGGTQTFRYATNSSLDAYFPYYGTGPTNPDDIARIKGPVYGSYGGNDNRVTSTVEKSTELMKNAGKTYDAMVYDGAGHGFMRSGQDPAAQPENKKARDQAWERMLKLLRGL